LALLNIKGHPVALIERFEPRFVDAGMMNEYIRTIFLGSIGNVTVFLTVLLLLMCL